MRSAVSLSRSAIFAVIGSLAVASAAAVMSIPAPARASAPATPSGWTPVWVDDFNGPAGSAVDSTHWSNDTGGSGWGNNELEYYTSGSANAALDGQGDLVITARKENPANYQCWYGTCTYTSARLLTQNKFTQQYGRIEARIKLPYGQGLWPAFWMLGSDIGTVGWPTSGEVDIMENIGSEPSTNHGSMHGPGYSGGSDLTASYTLPSGETLSGGFHTFDVEWAPDIVQFYVDGNLYETRTPRDIGTNQWVFNQPFFLLLNVAVGGNWPGSPDSTTTFPQTMTVDYVAVYQRSTDPYGQLQAENWSNQSGTQSEASSDSGGGADVGWIGNGDWLEYDNINFGTSPGAGAVTARVASGSSNSGNVEVHLDSLSNAPVATIPVSNTGGWQTWVSKTAGMSTITGTHTVYLKFTSSQTADFVNVNWFDFGQVSSTRDAFSTIQAESDDAQSGTQTEPTTDVGGGLDVGWIGNGDWLRYDNVDFGAGGSSFVARLASGAAAGVGGSVEVRLDSLSNPAVASVGMSNTGGWQSWVTKTVSMSGVSGVHTVYLAFTSAGSSDFTNVNWFDFGQGTSPSPSPSPSLSPSPSQSPSGVLVNGGFEGGLAPWTCQPGGGVVTSPVHSGSYALSVAATSSQTGECDQTLTLTPNTGYTLTGWVQGSYAYLGVSGGANASTWTSSTGWAQLSVPFTTDATGQVTVYIHGWYGTGTVYADDITVS